MQAGNSAHWKQFRLYKNPLILALVIHLVFILMLESLTPDWKKMETPRQKPAKTPMLSVSLKQISPAPVYPEPVYPEPVQTATEAEIRDKTEPATGIEHAFETVAPQEPLPQETQAIQKTIPQHSARLISSQELRTQLLVQLKRAQDTNTSVLGEFSSRDLPDNWTRKTVDYTPGMFKAAELPTKAVLLDEWKSGDGSMHTKIKLPNGDTVCGSSQTHNPLDIYSMPIWTYHSC